MYMRKMRDIQLGSHTVRSHGLQMAKAHKHDWLILILLIVIDVILNLIRPFYCYVGEQMINDFKYPLQDNTVPVWAVPILAIVLPFAVIIAINFRRKDVYALHHAILGLLFSVLITAVITDAIKDAVGRPRPDFFWHCFPDGKPAFENVTRNVICHGEDHVIKEGHKSFPSGYTSWSFAGLGFLSLYLAGNIKVFDQRGHAAKLCIIFLPLLVAALVGISRVDDYWHHWQDVFAGGLIGSAVAILCYLQFFPPPYRSDGWGPTLSTPTVPLAMDPNTTNEPSADAEVNDVKTFDHANDDSSHLHSGDGASPGKKFVGGLAKETTDATFRKHFETYGEITDIVITRDRQSRQPRGFGFVTYADPSVVDKVIQDNHVINGKQVEIKRTIPKGAVAGKDLERRFLLGEFPPL